MIIVTIDQQHVFSLFLSRNDIWDSIDSEIILLLFSRYFKDRVWEKRMYAIKVVVRKQHQNGALV